MPPLFQAPLHVPLPILLEILILKTLYPIHRNPSSRGRMQKELGCVEVLECKGGGEAEGVGGSWYFLSLKVWTNTITGPVLFLLSCIRDWLWERGRRLQHNITL